jgi:hypothetical protein
MDNNNDNSYNHLNWFCVKYLLYDYNFFLIIVYILLNQD